MTLKSFRTALGISQSKLARISGVSRFKICTYELGSGSLSPEDQNQISEALQAELERLRGIPARIDTVSFPPGVTTQCLSQAELAYITGIDIAELVAIAVGLRQPTAEDFERVIVALSRTITFSRADKPLTRQNIRQCDTLSEVLARSAHE